MHFIDRDKDKATQPSPPDSYLADKSLSLTLQEEAPGILAWIVQGCLEWQKHGLPMSEPVFTASQSYRTESDIIGSFLDECCELEPTFTAKATDLFKAYQEWCKQSGEQSCTQTLFGRKLAERGFVQYKAKGYARWRGLTLKNIEGVDSLMKG